MKEGINGWMSGWVGGWMGRLCVNTHFCQWYEFSFPLCGWFKDRLEEVSGWRGEDDPDSLLNWKHLCVSSGSIFARTSSQMWLIPVSQETSPPHQKHVFHYHTNLRPGDAGSPLAWSEGLMLPVVTVERRPVWAGEGWEVLSGLEEESHLPFWTWSSHLWDEKHDCDSMFQL